MKLPIILQPGINFHLVNTKEKSKLFLRDKILTLLSKAYSQDRVSVNQFVIITNDSEIKNGELVIGKRRTSGEYEVGVSSKVNKDEVYVAQDHNGDGFYTELTNCKKIIASSSFILTPNNLISDLGLTYIVGFYETAKQLPFGELVSMASLDPKTTHNPELLYNEVIIEWVDELENLKKLTLEKLDEVKELNSKLGGGFASEMVEVLEGLKSVNDVAKDYLANTNADGSFTITNVCNGRTITTSDTLYITAAKNSVSDGTWKFVKKEDKKTLTPATEDIKTHLSHCYQGEYEISCKYGDDENCPARKNRKRKHSRQFFVKENLEQLSILTGWCIKHDVSFSGKETSVITSAMDEYAKANSTIMSESLLSYVKEKIAITEQMQKEDKGLDPSHSQFLSGLANAYDDIKHELENGQFKTI